MTMDEKMTSEFEKWMKERYESGKAEWFVVTTINTLEFYVDWLKKNEPDATVTIRNAEAGLDAIDDLV